MITNGLRIIIDGEPVFVSYEEIREICPEAYNAMAEVGRTLAKLNNEGADLDEIGAVFDLMAEHYEAVLGALKAEFSTT